MKLKFSKIELNKFLAAYDLISSWSNRQMTFEISNGIGRIKSCMVYLVKPCAIYAFPYMWKKYYTKMEIVFCEGADEYWVSCFAEGTELVKI